MEIFGFIMACLGMSAITFYTALAGLLGGCDLSALPFKQYWWYLPLVGMNAWGWKVVIAAAPFMVIVN